MLKIVFKKFSIVLLLLTSLSSFSQTPTIGLRSNQGLATDGYTLFSPEKDTIVYLIDKCGQIINQWGFSEKPGATCYLLPNGDLLRAGKDSLEIRDWNNTLLWSYAMNLNGYKQHHDIEPLPNGNILCLLTDAYTDVEMIAQGRDPSMLSPTFRLDKLVELQPIGTNDASLVWEWKFMDHLIQDHDSSKQNYGTINNHPEVMDLNYQNGYNNDYTHVNAIDYNAGLDQILLSARHLNEIYIIDHSTTTAEAAGHLGGNANRGGDFLWRWGNSKVYIKDSNDIQKLFFQHDCKWVEQTSMDAGKISVFNNGGDPSGKFSAVHIIDPVFSNGEYLMQGSRFLPSTYDYSWQGTIMGDTLLEGKKSGVESLVSGNLLICESSKGQITEVERQTGNVVWVYQNPLGSQLYSQGSTIQIHDNSIFRAQRYSPSFTGFSGKDLTPQGIIEDVNSVSSTCITLGVEDQFLENLRISNPVSEHVHFNKEITATIKLYNMAGQLILHIADFTGTEFPVSFKTGLYILELHKEGNVYREKLVLQ
jgi:hypothetical protein